MLKSESERIALVRTIAPLVWAFLLLRIADFGLQFDTWAADAIDGPGGIDSGLINSAATVVIAVVLWLVARFAPKHLDRLLMWIPVTSYAYGKPDGELVVPTGRVPHAAGVLDEPNQLAASDTFTDIFIARHPTEAQLRSAAARLLAAADDDTVSRSSVGDAS